MQPIVTEMNSCRALVPLDDLDHFRAGSSLPLLHRWLSMFLDPAEVFSRPIRAVETAFGVRRGLRTAACGHGASDRRGDFFLKGEVREGALRLNGAIDFYVRGRVMTVRFGFGFNLRRAENFSGRFLRNLMCKVRLEWDQVN